MVQVSSSDIIARNSGNINSDRNWQVIKKENRMREIIGQT